jgi:Protein of unknown function (DUF3592)
MKIFTIVFSLIIAILCFWMDLKMIFLYFKVKKWQKVEAEILDKNVVYNPKGMHRGRAVYMPKINYEYSIDGKNFKGSYTYLEELLNGTRSFMKSSVEKFIVNIKNKETIFVNPSKPEESVIFCDGIGKYILVVFMGILSLFIGLVFAIS